MKLHLGQRFVMWQSNCKYYF